MKDHDDEADSNASTIAGVAVDEPDQALAGQGRRPAGRAAAVRRRRLGASVRAADPSRGVYGISVAADLTGLGAQNLRLYEARGLLEPDRTPGGARRYSPEDIDRLHRIADLLNVGLNLAGIAMVLDLDLQDQNTRLRAQPAPGGPP